MTDLAGSVQTVLGPVPPSGLGITLPHEHLFVDLSSLLNVPPNARAQELARLPFTVENLGWIRYNYFSHYDNVILENEETCLSELSLFRRAGGGTIVDVTTVGIGRDPIALARVARASGINVVMATGYYVEGTHPRYVGSATEQDLVNRMVNEIREGAILDRIDVPSQDVVRSDQQTDIKAGIIKIGCSYPLTANEKKALSAASETQRQTGAAITIHVGRHDQSALEIIEFLLSAGADIKQTIIGHLDIRIEHLDTLDEVAKSGCYLEFDLFGHEISNFPNAPRDMPSDAQRLDLVEHVIDLGFLERILISHDIANKHRLSHYGGHGYGYIPECVAPRMRERGFSASAVSTILVSNPARALAFAPV